MKTFLAALLLGGSLFASAATADPLLDVFPHFTIGPYAGLRAGYAASSKEPVIGANVGYDLGIVRLETDYDRLGFRTSSSNVVTENAIVQYPLAIVTPYALAGVGYEWANTPGSFADHAQWRDGSALWNVGGGLRYPIGEFVELDARYRFMQPFTSPSILDPYVKGDPQHVLTLGTNIRF